MRLKAFAAAGAVTLAAAVAIPASPAYADSFRNDQWYLKTLKVAQAQAIATGAGITVAVVDTGVYPHPDLRKNLLPGANLIRSEGGDGRTDKVGHGTNVAATIAAHGRGSNGVLGIAPAAKILPIRTTNSEAAPPEEMTAGIEWAASQKASVINVSAALGPSLALEDAVAKAFDAGAVVVAGVGNLSGGLIAYPAGIDGVLAVGATGRDGKLASFSTKSPKVMICAPGVDITTAEPQSKYVDVAGTSISTAIVSGAVALVRAKFPDLSGAEVVHRITATADDIGPPGRDDQCGYGELDIVKALTADVPPLEGSTKAPTSATSSATGSLKPGYIDPTATTGVTAQAEPEPASSSAPLVIGGVLVGLVVAGGLIALLVVRRRRGF